MARLKDEYASRMVAELEKKLGVTNKMLVPRLQKIVINMGFGIVTKDEQKALVDDLTAITGQKPMLCKAKKGTRVKTGEKEGKKARVAVKSGKAL